MSTSPRPGSAPAGGWIMIDVPAPTRASVPAHTSTGIAGTTSCATVIWSVALPSAVRAATCHFRPARFSGAVTFHDTGTAPPAGIVTVSARPVAMRGIRSTVAVTVIGLSEPFLSVKLDA